MSDVGVIHVVPRDGWVVLRIDHPAARNALTDDLLQALADHAEAADRDPEVRAIVLAGSERVFASGADLRSLARRTAMAAMDGDRTRNWSRLRGLSTPTVAAVSGYCLGGGAELAMMCDVVVASPSLKLGLPETALGLLPGAGGTQMLPRAVGKAVAMDMVLTGRVLSADEALAMGVVSRVSEEGAWLELAEEVAATIASRSSVAQRLAKQAVRTAFETGLGAGVEAERALFTAAFSSDDATEGVAAFLDKRPPTWTHR
ncbi:enoyl-CoA hydratase [Ornithinimicrobium humiphilum]|uniref:enoyl-CoA hydratase n=1 Tax=Ornithinimicrobium humiphilum TaxID=125288 RepID=A0A543KRQ5_9MICO|nr:enoyl-CoA hydratase-related protein [Ornithinimicrobium humiphilum]TQM97754.1 short chain enoyl-CoA hydratase [Ornithinimicrobium humiphilum]